MGHFSFRPKLIILDEPANTSSTPVEGVSKVSGLKQTTETVEYREGDDGGTAFPVLDDFWS